MKRISNTALYECSTSKGVRAVTCRISDTLTKIKHACWMKHGLKVIDVISETVLLGIEDGEPVYAKKVKAA